MTLVSLHALSCEGPDDCTCEPVYVRENRPTVLSLCDNERDGGLSTDHAIMRSGPQVRLSPGLGAARVSRRLRP